MTTLKISDVRPGDVLVADGGFTCMRQDTHCVVKADENGELYVECDEGRHLLSGQLDFDDQETLVGLTKEATL